MQLWDEKSKLYLLTPEEFDLLPDGFIIHSIFGNEKRKGIDVIDDDTRNGHLAYGIRDLENHPQKDDVLWFLLKRK